MTQVSSTGVEIPQIPRDRYDRPMVIPPSGGGRLPYTRCTTYVGAIEDTYALDKWKQRMVARGLHDRPDLLSQVGTYRNEKDSDDKANLNRVCADALDAGGGGIAAATGTLLHSITEAVDRGQEPEVPPHHLADVAAYVATTEVLTATHIEQFCVLDALKIGGTPDRVVRYQGKRYIADLKTGSINYGHLKIAAQLAVYARSLTYDVATDERGEHGADQSRGIVIHLPAGTGECRLYWCNLDVGWEAVKVCRDVREMRGHRFAQVMAPLLDHPALTVVQNEIDLPGVEKRQPSLAEQIVLAPTADEVRNLWQANQAVWTDELTAIAQRHVQALFEA